MYKFTKFHLSHHEIPKLSPCQQSYNSGCILFGWLLTIWTEPLLMYGYLVLQSQWFYDDISTSFCKSHAVPYLCACWENAAQNHYMGAIKSGNTWDGIKIIAQ